MQNDFITGAATITAEILRQKQASQTEITEEVVAAAFEKAYRGLEKGVARVLEKELNEAFD